MICNTLESPVGRLYVHIHDDIIHEINFDCADTYTISAPKTLQAAFDAYFKNPGQVINLPLNLSGTAFQRRVWEALRGIPAGQTRTYGELAKALDSHPRAVGQALKRNPCPIVVPCHRVVSKTGMGGFAGATCGKLTDIKAWLLQHEQHGTT